RRHGCFWQLSSRWLRFFPAGCQSVENIEPDVASRKLSASTRIVGSLRRGSALAQSLLTQRDNRIDARRAQCSNATGCKTESDDNCRAADHGKWIDRIYGP